ncbi:metal-dependent hydrolase [Candidatus Fokinia solitaria]|uniref:Metal-dependent hydrolase n=1 Tax=Candidatus Fokinia solitaria TaxID=1802984 RepID=A0A2U8BRV1_9RICK|nr:MBL fold metallo-hydrolase [Candidatus Fokinia solitaria]AWD33057.1 metal-dependent hydrolase [Candidatus Fokinia solitaria]
MKKFAKVVMIVLFVLYVIFKMYDTQLIRYKSEAYANFNMMKYLIKNLSAKSTQWPDSVQNKFDLVPESSVNGKELKVFWVGHSTFLIQLMGVNILTDPIWSDRATPWKCCGPKRVHKPGVQFSNLPRIDVVLISHNHYDHMDLDTIELLWNRDHPRIISLPGNDAVIHRRNDKIKVEICELGEELLIKRDLSIVAEEALHWSSRYIIDANVALWGAFVIKSSIGNIYFAGDTAYGSHFIRMSEKYTSFRLALLPIGASLPQMTNHPVHMSPSEAVQAFLDLSAEYGCSMHHMTFKMSNECYSCAKEILDQAIEYNNIPPNRLRNLEIGESWSIP